MKVILNDETKFHKMENEKDKTVQIEKALSRLLRELKEQNAIDQITFERIRPIGTTIPRLYGLPKVHKANVPLRPILDMCNSPYHTVAKWLANTLEPIRHKIVKYSLKDTFEFVKSMDSLNSIHTKMFSLDVSSLFTSVPLEETIDYLCNYIQVHNCNICLPPDALKRLLLFCTRNVQFKFNGEIYRQKDGVAMGSPLGPLLADIFMASLENTRLLPYIDNFHFYKRYVDDILCMAEETVDLQELLRCFNSVHNNINFTLECEKDKQINFLDVLLTRRSDGSFKRAIHRKATWNDQYLHFSSFIPMRMKRNLIHCLTGRAMKICTDDAINDELKFLRNLFTANGYPEHFVDKNMKLSRKSKSEFGPTKKNVYLSLPFKGDIQDEILTKRLTHAVKNTFNAGTIRLHFTSSPLLRLRLKDKVSDSAASFCVYRFTCSCGACYIGRTTRRLSERIREHHPAWLGSGVIKSINSSICAHLVDSNHTVQTTQAFRPIYLVRGNQSKLIRHRILTIAEAVGIRLFDPILCAQKQFIQALKLPWPTSHPPLKSPAHPNNNIT